MTILHAIILGIIEGVTEFLPISSTGHLILASEVMKIPQTEFLKTFEIAIQLGAILSVIYLYWGRLIHNFALIKKIIVAFIPTILIGFAAYPLVKNYLLGSTQVVLWALFLGGIAIIVLEQWFKSKLQGTNLEQISYKQALGIGLAQSIAVIPGVSRAAATILGGMLAGLDRKSIVEFSFLLAIPTMAGATVLDLSQTAGNFSSPEFAILVIGFIVSSVTAFFAVKWLLKYVQSNNFIPFGVYRIALAVLFWVLLM